MRTNNDAEGYHRKINSKVSVKERKQKRRLYAVLKVLAEDAKLPLLQETLLRDGKF